MRIAVTYDPLSKEAFQHFGQTQYFYLVDVKGEDKKATIVDNGGYSHRELIPYLKQLGVDILIAGGMGNHAYELLKQYEIEAYPGQSGLAVDIVNKYLHGELKEDINSLHDCGCHHEK